jgi:hypothetical protein
MIVLLINWPDLSVRLVTVTCKGKDDVVILLFLFLEVIAMDVSLPASGCGQSHE